MVMEESDGDKSVAGDVPNDLFKDVRYFIVGNVDKLIEDKLSAGGGRRETYMTDNVTHVVADEEEDEVSEARDLFQTTIVKSSWIIQSVKCKTLLPTSIFDPDPKNQVFAQCVMCPSQLSAGDSKIIWGLVKCHGGEYQTRLNSTVTHLVTTSTEGAKYDCAKKRGIEIVTPDWILLSVEGQIRLDEARYHPDLLIHDDIKELGEAVKPPSPSSQEEERAKKQKKASREAQARTSKQHANAALRIKESFINEYDDDSESAASPPPPVIHSFPPPPLSTPTIPIIKIKALPPPPTSTVASPSPSRASRKSRSVVSQSVTKAVTMPVAIPGLSQPVTAPKPVTIPQPGVTIPSVTNQSVSSQSIGQSVAKLSTVITLPVSTQPVVYSQSMHPGMLNQSMAAQSATFSQPMVTQSAMFSQQMVTNSVMISQSMATQPMIFSQAAATPMYSQAMQSVMPNQSVHSTIAPQSMAAHSAVLSMRHAMFQQPNSQGMPMMPALGPYASMNASMRMIPPSAAESVRPAKSGGRNSKSNAAKQQQQHQLSSPNSKQISTSSLRPSMATTHSGFTTAAVLNSGPAGVKTPLVAAQHGDIKAYYGHDSAEHIPEDICLLGCVFYITDYQKTVSAAKIDVWKQVIAQYGGQVDDSYSNRITHVLCEHQRSDVFQLALRDGKRLVTAFWLSDCLLARKMTVPYVALHFPYIFGKDQPCANQIICMTSFDGEERTHVKNMILQLGAKYTGYMTRANSVLVARRPGGRKYQKAIDWQIPIVNVHWLSSILLGDLYALKIPVHSRYQTFSEDPFRVDPVSVSHLLEGWRVPVKISKETWKKFQSSHLLKSPLRAQNAFVGGTSETPTQSSPLKYSTNESAQHSPNKRRRLDFTVTDEAGCKTEGLAENNSKPIVLITGLPRVQAAALTEEIERLGGQIAGSPRRCTHIVTVSILRTVKFLAAFSVTQHIVTPEWIENSIRAGHFVDEAPYIVKDEKTEAALCFSLQESLQRTKQQKVFKGLSFYITPSVLPGISVLSDIIESAGGRVLEALPSIIVMQKMVNSRGDPSLVIITCLEDLYMCQHLATRNIGLYNAELVLTGVIRQSVDYQTFRFEI